MALPSRASCSEGRGRPGQERWLRPEQVHENTEDNPAAPRVAVADHLS